jgi:hypothetical protein
MKGRKGDTYREVDDSVSTPVFQRGNIICTSSPIFFFIATCTLPCISFKFLPNVVLKMQYNKKQEVDCSYPSKLKPHTVVRIATSTTIVDN